VRGRPAGTRCALCRAIRDDLTIRTGYGESFPAVYGKLERVSDAREAKLYRCPTCRNFYRWIDLPQYYGSGCADEERFVRLDAATSRLLDPLFPEDPANPEPVRDPAPYVSVACLGELLLALEHHVFTAPKIVAPFVPGLVRLLVEGDCSTIDCLLSNYSYRSPEQAREILAAFAAVAKGPLRGRAKALRDACRHEGRRVRRARLP
jgi:hypothetical protein